MKRSVLITGGLGFIGRNLDRLLEEDYDVRIIDNLSSCGECADAGRGLGGRVIVGDLLDEEACRRATKGVDIVVHLAARGSVVDSVIDPVDNFNNNVRGTFNILRAAGENGVKKVVFSSTGGALMGNCKLPVTEESIPAPISPYGASKLAGEGYCRAFANVYGMSVTILRFANVYGPYSAHKKGLINAVIGAMLSGSPIKIYGDGSASRDFLYVEDICRGIVGAMRLEHEQAEVFHIASGLESTILQVVDLLRGIGGREDHPVEFCPPRAAEVGNNYASYEKAHAILGFTPEVALRDGLEATWEWLLLNRPA